jgi:DNA-binding NarL/FixJ family response regulator
VTNRRGGLSHEDQVSLTPPQREVARLIAAGLTDGEIAARLSLGRDAVADDVEAILKRLGILHRTRIALWAVAVGLTDAESG